MHSARNTCCAVLLGTTLLCVPAFAADALQTAAPPAEVQYGAHPRADGWVDFDLHAPAAATVDLLLYDAPDAKIPANTEPMQRNAAGDWMVSVRGPGIGPGTLYMYRVTGQGTATSDRPFGTVLNGNFVLNDPYADQTQEVGYSRVYASTPFVDGQASVYAGGGKDIVHDHAADSAPGHVLVRPEDLILYELHVQDYTASLASLAPGLRGTYLGLAQPGLRTPGGLSAGIDHLGELGVTAVELMPVVQYDAETADTPDRLNHWGYMSTNSAAPEARYASVPGAQVTELKSLVQAFHARGIAVFLDVVFNHTAEGNWLQNGRLAFKCYNLCDDVPEIYRANSAGGFVNDSGTGNDVDFSGGQRFTKQLVQDSLARWYGAYGIDGFRFDLGLLLADGSSDAAAWVGDDPRYAAAHLHAEPWDTAQAWFAFMDSGDWNWQNNRWAKWLGRYRDAARQFSKSNLLDPVILKHLIEGRDAIGASDPPASSKPWRSIDLVTVHDGYTLRDCTLFDDDEERCWSSSNDEDLRRKREKLLLGVLMTSAGAPLLQQGDEFGRSKSGAGQAVAKNSWEWESASGDAAVNAVNWIDWGLKDGTPVSPGGASYGPELNDWTRGLIALRRRWTHLRRAEFADYAPTARAAPGDPANDGKMSYAWEGPPAGSPSQLAAIWWGKPGEPDLMVVYNENWTPFAVSNLSDWSSRPWHILARSWLPRGQDLCAASDITACPDAGPSVTVAGRSMAILAAPRE